VAVVVPTVNVDVAVPLATGVMDVKLNPHVTVEFTGATEQVKPTTELNPLKEVTVIVEIVEFPTVVVAETGEALKLKLLTAKI
jgi:hypothetical protein